MNGREASDTAPLADMFNGKVEHFVYMSSAGVYKKSPTMPHIEGDQEDQKSRHKGKLETEAYLREIGIPFTSIRPTYIYGPMNYNPLGTRQPESRLRNSIFDYFFLWRLFCCYCFIDLLVILVCNVFVVLAPTEEYFFMRVTEGRRVCIPGHGQHVTGLGHVEDLAVAMSQVR